MKTLDKRLTGLENEHGVGSRARALTEGERWFLTNWVLNATFQKELRISEDDLNAEDFLFGGRFAWRTQGNGDQLVWFLRFQNRVREEAKTDMPVMTAEDHHYLDTFEKYWERMGVLQ